MANPSLAPTCTEGVSFTGSIQGNPAYNRPEAYQDPDSRDTFELIGTPDRLRKAVEDLTSYGLVGQHSGYEQVLWMHDLVQSIVRKLITDSAAMNDWFGVTVRLTIHAARKIDTKDRTQSQKYTLLLQTLEERSNELGCSCSMLKETLDCLGKMTSPTPGSGP